MLVWNVRGLNSHARQSVLCQFVQDHLISIVCIQETKVQLVSSQLIVDACGSHFSDFISIPSVGLSGGLIIAWDDSIVHLEEIASAQNFLLVSCCCRFTGLT